MTSVPDNPAQLLTKTKMTKLLNWLKSLFHHEVQVAGVLPEPRAYWDIMIREGGVVQTLVVYLTQDEMRAKVESLLAAGIKIVEVMMSEDQPIPKAPSYSSILKGTMP
jgi:hypothetical protein